MFKLFWHFANPNLALEVDQDIFDEMLKPLLDVKSGKIVVYPFFNLDDDFPIKKITKN
jgi:hypothetical protein